jgi:anti-sigma B factor antagonist
LETAIGVFSSRDRAEEAVKELIRQGVPETSIVFLTRSEVEAKNIAQQLAIGGLAGGAAGISAGVIAASLLVPGIGQAFALGLGAAALLGVAGAGAGATMFSPAEKEVAKPTPDEKCPEDVSFFREVLMEGRSLIVVRTESLLIATAACNVLDSLGISMVERKTPVQMQTSTRQIDEVVVLDISGRITLGQGNVMLREIVRDLADKGNKRIVLNLGEVNYVDSSGLGELVKTLTTIRNKGGEMKLTNINKRVLGLLEMTRLSAVFDIQQDEATALASFRDQASARSAA